MPWPTPQDYNEAVQNPRSAFGDAELRAGLPELTQLGLPRPITGTFASVYVLQCTSAKWAVRCFLRRFADQQQRYVAIGEHLGHIHLPYAVGFTFQQRGIRVGGQWYPILKMEWVRGEPLDVFVAKHLDSPETLRRLAGRWVEMVRTLQRTATAHGDLQHGNVFVVGEDLRLVDYDGMWVPALHGHASHELGHRNYQHPLRSESDFGPSLDNFSSWVIYLSLVALATDQRLWWRFRGGEECLLFRRSDFEEPGSSDVFRALENSRDELVRSVAGLLRSLLYRRPDEVPSLAEQMPPPAAPPFQERPPGPNWIDDYRRPKTPDGESTRDRASHQAPPPLDPVGRTDSSWIFPLLPGDAEKEPSIPLRNSVSPERVLLASTGAAILLALLAAYLGVFSVSTLSAGVFLVTLTNFSLWVFRYRLEPGVAEPAALMSSLKVLDNRIRAAEGEVSRRETEKGAIRYREAHERADISAERDAAGKAERSEIAARQHGLSSVLATIGRRRQTLDLDEARALGTVQSETRARMSVINNQIASLLQSESTECADALRAQQEQHTTAYLRRFTLGRASIAGIGQGLKSRLTNAGFQTAADVDGYRVQGVRGVGPSRAASLVAWRRSLEGAAQASMPRALSPAAVAAIRAKYHARRVQLDEEVRRELRRQTGEEDRIRTQYRSSRADLDRQEEVAKANTERQIHEIQARSAQHDRSLQARLSRLEQATASALQGISGKIAEHHQRIYGLCWEREMTRRRRRAFGRIRFSRYVKRVFFGAQLA